MKILLFRFCLLACILLFSVACSRSEKLQGNEFLIEGKVSGVKDGVVVELMNYNFGAGYNIASDTIRKGRFIFKEEAMSYPNMLFIRYQNSQNFGLRIWVEPGAKIKIKGKGTLHHLWKVKSSIPYQKEEDIYTKKARDIITELSIVAVEFNEAIVKIMTDRSLAYREIITPIEERRDSLYLKRLFTYINIMEQTNISPVWLQKMFEVVQRMNLMFRHENDLRTKAIELYGRMTEEDKNTFWGNEITFYLLPPIVGVGDNMADADFFDVDGNTKHVADYLGKYLLLDFWAQWCGPCIAAIPEMKEIAEVYRDKLTIIGISHDNDADWKEAMTKHDKPWVNIRDPKGKDGLAAHYGASGLPYYVLISHEGKLVDKWAGYGKGYLKQKVSENIK